MPSTTERVPGGGGGGGVERVDGQMAASTERAEIYMHIKIWIFISAT